VQGALLRQIAKTGVIPDNDAETARQMAQLCQDKWGWEPDNRHLRRFIAKLLGPARDPL
jgi:hypothetical protein